MWGGVNDLLSSVDAALFGRVTYQDFERFWPVVPDNPASPKNEFDFSRWIDEALEAPRCAWLDPSASLRAGSRGARPHTTTTKQAFLTPRRLSHIRRSPSFSRLPNRS